jgi:hypothetical protein
MLAASGGSPWIVNTRLSEDRKRSAGRRQPRSSRVRRVVAPSNRFRSADSSTDNRRCPSSPGSHRIVNPVPPVRSRTNASRNPPVYEGYELVRPAFECNDASIPEIAGESQSASRLIAP